MYYNLHEDRNDLDAECPGMSDMIYNNCKISRKNGFDKCCESQCSKYKSGNPPPTCSHTDCDVCYDLPSGMIDPVKGDVQFNKCKKHINSSDSKCSSKITTCCSLGCAINGDNQCKDLCIGHIDDYCVSSPSPPLSGCTSDNDCGVNQICDSGNCVNKPSPPLGGGCTSDNDCGGNQICGHDGNCTDVGKVWTSHLLDSIYQLAVSVGTPSDVSHCIVRNIANTYTPDQLTEENSASIMRKAMSNCSNSKYGLSNINQVCLVNDDCKSGKCVNNKCVKTGLSTGVIIGISVGSLILLIGIILLIRRMKK